LVRQLSDHKGGIDLERLREAGLEQLAQVAGELLARSHARSGDACMISGYCGSGAKIARAVTAFARAYADQTEADYRKFLTAIKRKKIPVAQEAV
jgi:thiamine monophosphate kinase